MACSMESRIAWYLASVADALPNSALTARLTDPPDVCKLIRETRKNARRTTITMGTTIGASNDKPASPNIRTIGMKK
jgi:hypothetical protein